MIENLTKPKPTGGEGVSSKPAAGRVEAFSARVRYGNFVTLWVSDRRAQRTEQTSFENDWNPLVYLKRFYNEVEQDEKHTILYTVKLLKEKFGDLTANGMHMPANDELKPGQEGRKALVFGTGPAMKDVFALIPYVSEIDLADFLPRNVEEIRKWHDNEPDAWDWKKFIEYTLQCERNLDDPAKVVISDEDINARIDETRRKISSLISRSDANKKVPFVDSTKAYDVVFSPYTADSATKYKPVWWRMMKNIVSTVKPGGLFLTAALRDCIEYPGGIDEHGDDIMFPGANINETHMKRRFFALDFHPNSINVEKREVTDGHGYTGIVLAHGIRQEYKSVA